MKRKATVSQMEEDLFSFSNKTAVIPPSPKTGQEPQLQPEPQVQPQSHEFQLPDESTTERPARCLVVSIHDISPHTREVTERILSELHELGVTMFSLLVIPDHHHKGHFLDNPEFCAWLREQDKAGNEIVMHGYYHRRDQRAGETLLEKVTTRIYTAGEGEFFDIAGADALRIISDGRQEFRKIGIDPQGFVAPAWLLSEGAQRALERLGIGYTTSVSGVHDFTTGIEYHSRSLVWSTRSWLRRRLSLQWNASLFRRVQASPLLRISIHPADIRHPAVWQQIKDLTAKALVDRAAVTYRGFLRLK